MKKLNVWSFIVLFISLFGISAQKALAGQIEIGTPCNLVGEYKNWSYLNDHRQHDQIVTLGQENQGRSVDLNIECENYDNNGPAYAPISGTVFKGVDSYGANFIEIYGEGDYSGIKVVMVHFSELNNTLDDGNVTIGEEVGKIGSSGYSFGPHIHLEVWNGGARLEYSQWRFWQMPNPLFQTVFRQDKGIYTRSSGNGYKWSPWIKNGKTSFDIATVVFKDLTYQAVVGETAGEVYERVASNGIWSEWKKNGGKAKNDITLQVFGSRLYEAVQGTTDQVYTRNTYDGINWSEWSQGANPMVTWSQVAMVVHNNELYQAVRSSDNNIYFRKTNNGSFDFPWKKTAIKTIDDIELASYNGGLFMASRGEGNELHFSVYNPSLETFMASQDGTTKSSVDMEVFNNRLYITKRGIDNAIHTKYIDTTTGQSSGWLSKGSTTAMPTLKVYKGSLYQAVKGTDGKVYLRYTTDGNSWTGWGLGDAETLSEVSM